MADQHLIIEGDSVKLEKPKKVKATPILSSNLFEE
jgi:hypothetical protein